MQVKQQRVVQSDAPATPAHCCYTYIMTSLCARRGDSLCDTSLKGRYLDNEHIITLYSMHNTYFTAQNNYMYIFTQIELQVLKLWYKYCSSSPDQFASVSLGPQNQIPHTLITIPGNVNYNINFSFKLWSIGKQPKKKCSRLSGSQQQHAAWGDVVWAGHWWINGLFDLFKLLK